MTVLLDADGNEYTEELREAIAASAVEGISEFETDGTRVRAESLAARVQALKELQALDTSGASEKPQRGLRFSGFIPPGTG